MIWHCEGYSLWLARSRRGRPGQRDVDLLVIMPVEGSKRQKAIEIDRALAGRRSPLDLIVVTPEDFERARYQIGSVLRPAVLEGRVMYERAAQASLPSL